MKRFTFASIAVGILSCVCSLAQPLTALGVGGNSVNLGTAANYTILAKTSISTTGPTVVVGDVGVSPASANYMTGFGITFPSWSTYATSPRVTGKVYASDYADPTPAILRTAVLDMQTAYDNAAGQTPTVTEFYGGMVGGITVSPGVYKWNSSVFLSSDVTLVGNATDVWVFQVGQSLAVGSGARIILSGGAQASNVYWVVAGQTTLGVGSLLQGNILDRSTIVLSANATLHGRALAQTSVSLDSNQVTLPGYSANPAPAVCTQEMLRCADGSYVGHTGPNCDFGVCPSIPAPVCGNDVAQCADGSYVGHTGLNCDFGVCPSIESSTPVTHVDGIEQVQSITANLYYGIRGESVATLQRFLISQNRGPAAHNLAAVGATGYFGVLTRACLAEFQAKVSVYPTHGYFGPITRAYISAHYN